MPEATQLLYLEPDDEITSVVRRLREADAGRVVLVASGRSKATTSAVALRLLAGVAAEEGRDIALVADPAGRTLAADAGIPAFASVAEASADDPVPSEPPPARRAPIRVVRGDDASLGPAALPVAVAVAGPSDETVVVSAPAPASRAAPRQREPRPVWTRGRPLPRAMAGALVAVLLLSAGALVAVAPAASIVVEPNSQDIEPVVYTITLPADGVEQGELTAEAQGTATGVFRDPSPATGTVVFSNWNTVTVEVPQGTQVAAGEVIFETVERIVVPIGFFTPFAPGERAVEVVALAAGPSGNVGAEGIDTVVTEGVRAFLRGLPDNPNRLVHNPDPTAGGSENRQPEVTQEDVDAAAGAIRDDLDGQLDEALQDDPLLLYAPTETGEPQIAEPDDLVGRRGEETFALSGTMEYRRAHVELERVELAAHERLLGDEDAAPAGRSIAPDTIRVAVEDVSAAGEEVEVRVSVAAEADPLIDADAIRDLVVGRTKPEAEAALAWLGHVDVELWPGWVDRVPQLEWRIDLRIETEPDAGESAGPSVPGSATP